MDVIHEFFRSIWVVWLGLIFLGIVAWALWPANRARFRHAASIPLADDDDEPLKPQPKVRA
jgi:cytochrome c oxidase cbb3-type subunit IV